MIDLNIYHKIKELKEMGVKHKKILEMVGISNKQYYRYATLDEEVFKELLNKDKTNGIDNYREFIISLISVTPQINNSTILFRTHEEFPDFSIKRNTYLRYIDKIRQETGYVKKAVRSYSLREEPIPGFEAQADFGQYVIKDMYGINRRIYMFCMVLSYSRMRFCYFSANPFTAKTAIEAHEYAFRYFGGRPQHILYDQDRVFVVSEMFGEYKLVKEFEEYVRFRGFTVQLCHKWDPDSKGKVETSVKAIKRGFLDGRIYAGIDSLNSECLIWLDNIGNGDINYTTRKIPRDMFIEETKHLQKVNFYKKKHDTILTVESTNSVV